MTTTSSSAAPCPTRRRDPVLAQLAADEGYSNVGVIYLNDPYGQGLAEAFEAAWGGDANIVSIEPRQASYLAELQQASDDGAEVLIVIAFPQEAEIFIREALEQGLFDEFLFVDGSRSQELVDAIGGEYLEGMRGTAPAPGPESESLAAFNEAYIAEFGELSPLPFIPEAYDAAMAIGLAAQAAGSLDPASIRDALREIAAPPGAIYPVGRTGRCRRAGGDRERREHQRRGRSNLTRLERRRRHHVRLHRRVGLRRRRDRRNQRHRVRSERVNPAASFHQTLSAARFALRSASASLANGCSKMRTEMMVWHRSRPIRRWQVAPFLVPLLVLTLLLASCDSGTQQPTEQRAADRQSTRQELPGEPLKLGLLLDFSGPLAEYGVEMLRGFELAIKHINEAGGVWGVPVETAVGDTAVDPTIAVEEARRLIDVEHIHGLVGPMSSAMALAVSESVSGQSRIPTISPVATSSQVTLADDDDFLFRVSLADRVEGLYLAQLAEREGYDNVGLLYRDDAFGQGMATAFEEHWPGTIKVLGIDPRAPSFIAELEQSVEVETASAGRDRVPSGDHPHRPRVPRARLLRTLHLRRGGQDARGQRSNRSRSAGRYARHLRGARAHECVLRGVDSGIP